jgi:hypothetical protein
VDGGVFDRADQRRHADGIDRNAKHTINFACQIVPSGSAAAAEAVVGLDLALKRA